MLCKICNRECLTIKSLNTHIIRSHSEVPTEQYYNEYLDKPLEHTNGLCLTCKSKTKFKGISKGYQLYCNNSCAVKSDLTQAKIKKTNLERTGYEHNSLNPESQKKMQATNRSNNGGVLYFQNKDNIKALVEKKIKKFGNGNNTEKIKKTNLEKYGIENQFQRPGLIIDNIEKKIKKFGNGNNIEKIKKTNLEKYGVESVLSLQRIHDDLKAKNLDLKLLRYTQLLETNNIKLISLLNNEVICKCLKCDKEFTAQQQLIRKRFHSNREICIECNPLISVMEKSKCEDEIYNFIKQYIDCEQSNRKILNGQELDIFIPSKKLAIEFNGLYWHSDEYKNWDYHLSKTESCEKLNIQLIHIYEDDWLYKQDIVKSRLKSLLGISDRRIFARKCEVKELSNEQSKVFLEKNHIQSSTNPKYRYGLFHNEELVACMTFGSSRFEKDKMELHRFANKLNTNVVGGASKLFKHFLKLNICSSIISYADRSWSQGRLYETLGFILINKTRPNYYYIDNDIRINRFKFKKSELVKQGFDISKTEVDIMSSRGFNRIYDSGSLKFEYNT